MGKYIRMSKTYRPSMLTMAVLTNVLCFVTVKFNGGAKTASIGSQDS